MMFYIKMFIKVKHVWRTSTAKTNPAVAWYGKLAFLFTGDSQSFMIRIHQIYHFVPRAFKNHARVQEPKGSLFPLAVAKQVTLKCVNF